MTAQVLAPVRLLPSEAQFFALWAVGILILAALTWRLFLRNL